MLARISTFALLLIIITGCRAEAQILVPETAHSRLTEAWHRPQHSVWEIEWPAMPLGGPLTVEIWRAGDRYRFEILEAPAPALIGETLIFDGQRAWQYNRFTTISPQSGTRPWLSPVSDVLNLVEQRLNQPTITATQQVRQSHSGPATKFHLEGATGDMLTMALDETTELPVQVQLSSGNTEIKLTARSFEPLPAPVPGLFEPMD